VKEIEMKKNSNDTRFMLSQSDLPKFWYNINADAKIEQSPPLNPATKQPASFEFMNAMFPKSLLMQEMSTERYIEIPEEVQEIYKLWRPTPLIRARRLEKMLDTPAHIYYKYEGASPTGSHKTNTSVPQAFFNKLDGTKAMTTETGAGQWGSALSLACQFFDMDLEVYMVKISYNQKPYRRLMMETYGAKVFASPTDLTESGREILAKDPDSPGSLGIAISEAVEMAINSNGYKKYSLGSVLNHVLIHQSIIGEECLKQMDMADEYPDVVIGCVGGGSNFAGIAFPFLRENLVNGRNTRFLAVEPTATPTLTKGIFAYDYGDTAQKAPIVKMHTLGHDFVPAKIHAGGLRYHGMAPTLCGLYNSGHIEAVAVDQLSVFNAGVLFARAEGIIPAPESNHAIRTAIDEALDAKMKGEKRVILFNLSGHGHFDMAAYKAYFANDLEDSTFPDAEISKIKDHIPVIEEPVMA
jgi:tryptophan synthase beta chain